VACWALAVWFKARAKQKAKAIGQATRIISSPG
jgi:hypothetical protein